MSNPKFQIPNETPNGIARSLRTAERQITELLDTLGNVGERIAVCGALQTWLLEQQRSLLMATSQTAGAAGGPQAAA